MRQAPSQQELHCENRLRRCGYRYFCGRLDWMAAADHVPCMPGRRPAQGNTKCDTYVHCCGQRLPGSGAGSPRSWRSPPPAFHPPGRDPPGRPFVPPQRHFRRRCLRSRQRACPGGACESLNEATQLAAMLHPRIDGSMLAIKRDQKRLMPGGFACIAHPQPLALPRQRLAAGAGCRDRADLKRSGAGGR